MGSPRQRKSKAKPKSEARVRRKSNASGASTVGQRRGSDDGGIHIAMEDVRFARDTYNNTHKKNKLLSLLYYHQVYHRSVNVDFSLFVDHCFRHHWQAIFFLGIVLVILILGGFLRGSFSESSWR